MRKLIPILLVAMAANVFAQGDEQTTTNSADTTVSSDVEINTDGLVTIASRGESVRNVLFDLFVQTKHNFVLEPNIHFILYLSLAGVEFEEALNIVSNVANLEYEIDSGIYFIGKKKLGLTVILTPKPTALPIKPIKVKRGKLTPAEMSQRITTRFSLTNLSDVFVEFTKQTGVEIIMDKDVPMYRIDAFLIDTTLEYALTVVARASGLTYKLTDDKQIRISKKKK